MKLNVKQNCSYKEFIKDIHILKRQYKEALLSFSVFEYHEKVMFIRQCKDQIYSLDYHEYLKDRIWNYLNGYLHKKLLQIKK